MKWKRYLNFIVLAVFALAGVAAVQWYSQQLATATFDDTDVLVVERAAPHALRSATLANLRTYMQIGVPTTNNLASTNYVNTATNSLASTNYVKTVTNSVASTNYVNTATNGLASTNYVNTTALLSTNGSVDRTNLADNTKVIFNPDQFGTNGSGPFNVFIRSNVFLTNPVVYGAQTNFSGAYSLASTTNSPSTLEFATAGWVRSLLGSGAHFYNSTNLAPGWLPTKGDAQPFLYIPDIPAPAVRAYASAYLTNNGYLGGIAITNLTQFEGPFVVATYLGFAGGIATPTITIKPEIYYSYDNGTNLLGDWDTQAQSITHGQTNLYSWVISVPSTVSTGGTFTVYRLFKIVSASFGGSPTLSVHVGTNTASHISFTQPVVAGGTYSGTFVGNGAGLTNVVPAPVTFGLANLASAMGSNTFWVSPNSIVVAMDFRSVSLVPLTTGNGSGGTSPTIGSGNSLYFSCYPTNTSGYSAIRHGSAQDEWYSNFIFDTSVKISGVEGTYFDIGLMASWTTTEDQTNAVRWIANTNFSSYWIASCTYDSTSSYWTSSIAFATGTNRLTIYAPTTNRVYFFTNGILACEIAENVPGGQSMVVGARANSLSSSGATASQSMYLYWWRSLFE